MQGRLDRLNKVHATLRSDYENSNGLLDSARQEVTSMKKQLEELEGQLAERREKVESLQQSLDAATTDNKTATEVCIMSSRTCSQSKKSLGLPFTVCSIFCDNISNWSSFHFNLHG